MKHQKIINFISIVLLGLCLALLSFRVTLGVDLSDEAYYAAFIDGWLKNGLRHNPNLMIHQTAAILIYPLAVIFYKIRGSSAEGLILFLRFVYLVIASLSAFCLYRAVAPSGTLILQLKYPGQNTARARLLKCGDNDIQQRTIGPFITIYFISFSLLKPWQPSLSEKNQNLHH